MVEKQIKILNGVCFRASHLCFLFAIAFTIYGFTSLEFLQKFDPSITLVNNTIPRFFLNGVPFVLLGFFCRSRKGNLTLKVYSCICGIPLLFTVACTIYVWPIIFRGNPHIYLYVHAANMFIIASTLITMAAPPKYMLIQVLCFVGFFSAPVSLMVFKEDLLIFKTMVNDLAIIIIVSSILANIVHKLRVKLAELDEKIKNEVSSFLGKPLAQSIYSSSLKPFESKTHTGVVLSLDLRGFTKLKKTLEKDQFRTFIKFYHRLVSQQVGTMGGYLLKSMGDGHIIFFGNFEEENLADLTHLAEEDRQAQQRILKKYSNDAFSCASQIINQFQNYINSLDFEISVAIGAAIDCGEIETMITGDDQHRREFDMTGDVLLRCNRLESFSKVLNQDNARNSYLIISPYCQNLLDNLAQLTKFDTVAQDKKIRDFPEIDFIYYEKFENTKSLLARSA